MGVNIGPATISIVQLMILAIGLGLTLAVWNSLYKNGTPRATAALIALPLFFLCVFIAFFKYSELTLIPFIAKLIRTNFLDVTKKFQLNRARPDPKAIALAKSRTTDHDTIITQKDFDLDTKQLQKLNAVLEEQ